MGGDNLVCDFQISVPQLFVAPASQDLMLIEPYGRASLSVCYHKPCAYAESGPRVISVSVWSTSNCFMLNAPMSGHCLSCATSGPVRKACAEDSSAKR